MKTKYFGLTETKLFHFHRIFKNGVGVQANPLSPSGSATEVEKEIFANLYLLIPICFIFNIWLSEDTVSLVYEVFCRTFFDYRSDHVYCLIKIQSRLWQQ